jgi:GTP-binding protein
LILVDLPGYGFSFASEKDVAGFSKLMSNYLLLRDSKLLKRVLLLIDARHGMKKADIDFLDMLQDEVSLRKRQQQQGDGKSSQAVTLPPLQIVLTKCDLVTQADLARRVSLVRQQLSDCLRREPSAAGLPVMLVSTRAINATASILQGDRPVTGGVLELQKELASLAVPRRNADS